jgi:hypothetical protein
MQFTNRQGVCNMHIVAKGSQEFVKADVIEVQSNLA